MVCLQPNRNGGIAGGTQAKTAGIRTIPRRDAGGRQRAASGSMQTGSDEDRSIGKEAGRESCPACCQGAHPSLPCLRWLSWFSSKWSGGDVKTTKADSTIAICLLMSLHAVANFHTASRSSETCWLEFEASAQKAKRAKGKRFSFSGQVDPSRLPTCRGIVRSI